MTQSARTLSLHKQAAQLKKKQPEITVVDSEEIKSAGEKKVH